MTIHSDRDFCAVCGGPMGYDGSVDDDELGRITCCIGCYESGRLKIWREELRVELADMQKEYDEQPRQMPPLP